MDPALQHWWEDKIFVCVKVTFEDVKGCDEAKQELQEVVEFLMNPDKFSALGTVPFFRYGTIRYHSSLRYWCQADRSVSLQIFLSVTYQ